MGECNHIPRKVICFNQDEWVSLAEFGDYRDALQQLGPFLSGVCMN